MPEDILKRVSKHFLRTLQSFFRTTIYQVDACLLRISGRYCGSHARIPPVSVDIRALLAELPFRASPRHIFKNARALLVTSRRGAVLFHMAINCDFCLGRYCRGCSASIVLTGPILRAVLLFLALSPHQIQMMMPSHFDTLAFGSLLAVLHKGNLAEAGVGSASDQTWILRSGVAS